MKKLLKSSFLVGCLFGQLISSNVFADDIRLGMPAYGGTGCPAGSASAALSFDQKSLSIIFDQFVATAGGVGGSYLSRKSCNIAIPVHVPQGLSLSILEVDYRGYNYLPSGSMSRFDVEYFFAGIRGPRYQKSFYGYLDSNYQIDNDLALSALVWSRCGEDVILRTNASILARTNAFRHETISTVDTADFRAGIVYLLQWRSC